MGNVLGAMMFRKDRFAVRFSSRWSLSQFIKVLKRGCCPRHHLRRVSLNELEELKAGPCAVLVAISLCVLAPAALRGQARTNSPNRVESYQTETTQDYNLRLEQLRRQLAKSGGAAEAGDYRIGANDLLEINVFEAPEFNRALRVSAGGEITMPLLGAVQCAGLTARELEKVLEDRLRKYMKDPHVGVFVSSIQSHPVSVAGAVKKPGVFQIQGPKTLLEMLSMAEGLADDAGDEVLVMRGAGLRAGAIPASDEAVENASHAPTPEVTAATPNAAGRDEASSEKETVRINLRNLLESGDERFNVAVYPGDIVKVTRAGIVYVVGEVKKPGGFVLKSHEQMSVLKAIALAEGLTSTSAKGRARIIRTDESTGEKTEVPVDLNKILAGKAPDPPLNAADIVFVPNSAGKSALYRGSEAALATASGLIIFHR
jgi:polysaccharide export outer membrane protein